MNKTREFDPPAQLIQIADEFLARVRNNESPSIEEFASRHPHFADDLRRYLPLVLSMEKQTIGPGASSETSAGEPNLPIPIERLPVGVSRYQLKALIGCGSMGAVYEAHDLELDRTVALKIPQLERATPHAIERFYREARAMATIAHPNICSVYDVGEFSSEDIDDATLTSLVGRPYFTMAFVAGTPLAQLMKQRSWTQQEAVALLIRLASAVHAAHVAGVVHRDLKPANILIDVTGNPIIMDFGLARRNLPDESEITLDGQILGSPAYMSPEQIDGRDPVGPATDIYALGVMLYELVCGKRPFTGSPLPLLRDICWSTPPKPSRLQPGMDGALEAICLKAIAKNPQLRYATAEAFAEDLQRYRDGHENAIIALPAGRSRHRFLRSPMLAGILACLLVATALTWPVWGPRTDTGPPEGLLTPVAARPAAAATETLAADFQRLFWLHFRFRAHGTLAPDMSQAYRERFSQLGITSEDTSVNDLQRFLESQSEAVRHEILIALESWLSCTARNSEDVPVPWLRSLVEHLHADHTPIRSAILELDQARLSVLIHQYAMEHYDPRLPVVWYLLLHSHDQENADLVLTKAMEASPTNIWTLTADGMNQKAIGNHGAAVKRFQAALAIEEAAELYTQMSVCLLNQKKLGEARQALERALELAPNYGAAHFLLGKTLFMQGAYAQALETLHEAIEENCSFKGQAYRFQALCCLRLGRYDEAMRSADNAIQIFQSRENWQNLARFSQTLLDEFEQLNEHGFVDERFQLVVEYFAATRELKQTRKVRPYITRLLRDLGPSEDPSGRIMRLERMQASIDRNRKPAKNAGPPQPRPGVNEG